MTESAAEALIKILVTARHDLEVLSRAIAFNNDQQRELLTDTLRNIKDAEEVAKDIDDSGRWYGRKSFIFEYLNTVVSFIPALVGVILIVLAISWLEKAGKERDKLRQLVTYDKGWATSIADSLTKTRVNVGYYEQAKRDSVFYSFFLRQKQSFDSANATAPNP